MAARPLQKQTPQNSGLSQPVSTQSAAPVRRDIYDPSLYDTSFQVSDAARTGGTTPGSGWGVGSRNYGTGGNYASQDADVRAAQYYLDAYNDPTRSRGRNITYKETGIRNLYEQAMQRVAQKKALSQSIQDAQSSLGGELNSIKRQGGAALGEGLETTRENFNSRGLLYSGARQGGEAKVRGQAAATMAESLAGARRDNQNVVNARKEAFARIGLADQAQQLERANVAFESSMRNQAARAQAIQQLAQGVGYGAGAIYGMSGGGGDSTSYAPTQSRTYVDSGGQTATALSNPFG